MIEEAITNHLKKLLGFYKLPEEALEM